MGEKDTLSMEYLSDNTRFADICNYCLFDGQEVIRAEDLKELDTKEFLKLAGLNQKGQQISRIRDILKHAVIRSTGDCTYLIIGVENQTQIHYAMPVRGMIYDALNYGRQVNTISKHHRDKSDLKKPAEFLSGFTADDYLTPVVTITVYWGSEPWDAPRSLHEMFHSNSALLKYVADYKLNLISPAEITDFEKFRTSVGLVLEVMKHQDSRQSLNAIFARQTFIDNLELDAAKVIEGFTGIKMDHNEEKEGLNMCKAWIDQYKFGVREGELRNRVEQSIKKLRKNISVTEAADMLETDADLIQRIYNAAELYAPDYDVDKIYAELQKEEESV